MNRAELKIRVDLFERELKQLHAIQIGCRSCEHYAMPECMKFQSSPPPDIVQQGCEEWSYDFIPF